MSTTEVALTDETGAVAYVDPSTVPEAPRTSHVGRTVAEDDARGSALVVLFTLVTLVVGWLTVIYLTIPRH